MRIYKKIYSQHGILAGQAAWTHDKKPGLRLKMRGRQFYDTISLEDLESQVLTELGVSQPNRGRADQ